MKKDNPLLTHLTNIVNVSSTRRNQSPFDTMRNPKKKLKKLALSSCDHGAGVCKFLKAKPLGALRNNAGCSKE